MMRGKTRKYILLASVPVFILSAVVIGRIFLSSDGRNPLLPTEDPAESGQSYVYTIQVSERAPLGLPVDDDAFYEFTITLQLITDPMAATLGLPYGRIEYFEYKMPDTLHADSPAPVESYLAGKLTESRSAGYDFSSLQGQKIAGCILIYGDVGASAVYIGLCGEDGQIEGLWADSYAVSTDTDVTEAHWTVLGLETERLE